MLCCKSFGLFLIGRSCKLKPAKGKLYQEVKGVVKKILYLIIKTPNNIRIKLVIE